MKHVQKAISLLLVLTMLLGIASVGITAVGAVEDTIISGSCGPSATYSYSTASKILTISGTGPMTEYTQDIKGAANTPWYEQDFHRDIKAIVINYGITTIGSYAFYNIVSCVSVVIPNSINNIGVMAFGSNTSLERVTIPDSVHIIQHHAFFNCPKIASGKLSSYPTTTSIGEGNEDLIAGSPHSTSLVTTASGTCGKAPNQNRITWSFSAQSGALMIDVASLGSSLTYEMADYTALTGEGSAPWSKYASQIKSISISAGVSSIGNNAFALSSALQNVTIGSDVQKIGNNAFFSCSTLDSVHLPKSTVTIGDSAFYLCNGLRTATSANTRGSVSIASGNTPLTNVLTYADATPTTGSCGAGVSYTYSPDNRTLEIYGNGAMNDYTLTNRAPWADSASKIETVIVYQGVTTLGNYALYGFSAMTSLNLGATVTLIGNSAVSGSRSLQTVALPASLTSIAQNAFEGCTGLTYATYPNSRNALSIASGNYYLEAVLHCGGSSTVPTDTSGVLANGIVWSFRASDRSLTLSYSGTSAVAIPDFTNLSDRPWNSLSSVIEKVYVDNNISAIGKQAFASLPLLTSLILTSSSLTTIGEGAFQNDTSIRTVNLPAQVGQIDKNAFSGCTGIVSATTPRLLANLVIDTGNEPLTRVLRDGSSSTPSTSEDNSGTLSGGITWSYQASTKILIFVNTSGTAVAIPDYNTTAERPWDYLSSVVEQVLVLDGISAIGRQAFADMPRLGTLILNGSSLAIIGEAAFRNDVSIKTVTLPQATRLIYTNAFYGCTGITAASTPNAKELMTIYNGNDPLTSKLTYGGSSGGGSDPATTVNNTGTLPNGVTWVWVASSKILSFSYNGSTGALPIPDYTSLSARPWHYLSNVVEKVFISTGISGVGAQALAEMPNLSTVLFDSTSLVSIGEAAFRNDVSIQTVTLPKETVLIYANAFSGCTGITAASTPNTQAQMTILSGNEPLTSKLTYAGGTTPTPGTTKSGTLANGLYWSFDTATGEMLIYGAGAMPSYNSLALTDRPWHDFTKDIKSLVVSSGVTFIGDYAFYQANNLKNVRLAATVAEIGTSAFTYCPYDITASSARARGTLTFGTGNETIQNRMTYSGTDPVVNPTNGYFGDGLYWSYDSATGAIIITGSGTMPSYSASTLTSRPWHPYISSIRSVTVAGSIVNVGAYAFYNAVNLANVSLSASVRTIGEFAFWGCLTNVTATSAASNGSVSFGTGNETIRNRMTYTGSSQNPGDNEITGTIPGTDITWSYNQTTHSLNLKGTGAIPNYTSINATPWAAYVNGITCVSVQTGITAIGNYAFANIPGLVDAFIANTVTSIGEGAFQNCSNLTNLELPNGLRTLGASAFYGCRALRNASLPSTLTSLGANAFRECSSLQSINIPGSVTSIGDRAFQGCTMLSSLTLNEGLTTIGSNAFDGCIALTNLVLPATLTQVGYEAFISCSELTSVVIKSLTKLLVREGAFDKCTHLILAVYYHEKPDTEPRNEYLENAYKERYQSGVSSDGIEWSVDRAEGILTLTYNGDPRGNGVVTTTNGWRDELPYVHTVIFGEGITGIGSNLLRGNRTIRHLVMQDGVTDIGDSAFEFCTGIRDISFSQNLIRLGDLAFANCTALETINLPDSLTKIPDSAFYSCTSLTAALLPSALQSIGKQAFYGCTKLASIVIPSTTESLGTGAFSGCTSLASVNLPNANLDPLTTGIFNGCTALSTVYFTGDATEWNRLSANADYEIKTARVIYSVTLTIRYLYADDTVAAPSVTYTGQSGEIATVVSPVIPNYTASQTTVTETLTTNRELIVRYTPNTYVLTVYYVDADGKTLMAPTRHNVVYGEAFTMKAPEIPGYSPRTTSVDIARMTGNTTQTIRYDIQSYTVTLQFRDINGNPIYVRNADGTTSLYPNETRVVKYNESLTITLPTINGYTATETTHTIDKVTGNLTVVLRYTPKTSELVVHYVDESGNKIADDVRKTYTFGDKVQIISPTITGYIPDLAAITIDNYSGQAEYTVTYRLRDLTVTIKYVEVNSNGYRMLDTATATVKYGASFTQTLPVIEGYTTEEKKLSVGPVTEDLTITVEYTRAFFDLTVNYTDEGGKVVGSFVKSIQAGSPYDLPLTAPSGYRLSQSRLKGTMGLQAETINVEVTTIAGYNFTLTIRYQDEDGKSVLADKTYRYAAGASYDIPLEKIKGYVADRTSVSGVMGKEDKVITITLTKKPIHKLTIEYVDKKGNVVATKEMEMTEGETYQFNVEELEGYTLKATELKGVMGTEDARATVSVEKTGATSGATIAIVAVVIVVVILGAAVAFYFCYLKKS